MHAAFVSGTELLQRTRTSTRNSRFAIARWLCRIARTRVSPHASELSLNKAEHKSSQDSRLWSKRLCSSHLGRGGDAPVAPFPLQTAKREVACVLGSQLRQHPARSTKAAS